MDTIYALATARGKAGVAVVRISGPLSFLVVRQLTGGLPAPRQASLRILRDPAGEPLDQALVLCFAAGASFTGEDVAELHLHGSTAVVSAVLRVLSEIDGLRSAEAGEFTRRALENGCLDLTQVEGLADLIDAETEAQRKQAHRVLSGAIGQKVESWRADLIRAAALLEVTIDFADEEVPVDVSPEVLDLLAGVMRDLEREVRGAAIAERLRDGFEVAIIGRPNAGKSTLLNAFAGRDAAITSDIAGTTRDVIEVRMALNGLPVTFLDTAGLRDTGDTIEKLGIERAIARAKNADLRLFLVLEDGLTADIEPIDDDLVIQAKCDVRETTGPAISAKTGDGIEALIVKITDILSARASGAATVTRERHRVACVSALKALEIAVTEVKLGADRIELAADEMRTAIRALESLVGRIGVETLLDEIFSSFCIGK
ncbi:tRNA modification GTPase MnmE [Aquimixticola soesokkakensis]|uniref:tRNA modification GTPase MnmE n=1 Tax=Aquimixticola soesokkakensis TaxID=1519096 RepID=A0A1Y5R9R7_9RHOB|nr:tRNA uridine-5-carboxymethylaminomethyl(34) synthesis GTPase MnmE [Aquimixticola soesokkakensis]SLN11706.1 tRNA modification GTPase MnmE [Aquimixticola soesokkakensis]